MINRRQWLFGMGAWLVRLPSPAAVSPRTIQSHRKHSIALWISTTSSQRACCKCRVANERAKFPVLDFHTHITTSAKSENGVELASEVKYLGTPEELLAFMDRQNIWAMVNLTGGYGKGLGNVIIQYDRAFSGWVVRIQAKTLQSD